MKEEWDGRERRKNYPETCFTGVNLALEEIKLKLTRIDGRLEATAKQYSDDYHRHQESLEKHEGTLYGNGKLGLTTQVKGVQDHLTLHKWVIGVVLIIVTGIAVKAIVH